MDDAAIPRGRLTNEEVVAAAGPSWSVTLLAEAPSTNAVAAADPQPGRVVVADHQTAGRGRLDRSWETPAGVALTFSAVVDPRLPDRRWSLLPLATGLAVTDAIHRAGGHPRLKWPNDVLIAGDDRQLRKLCGILLERVAEPPLAVIGIGINVAQHADELPVPTATSLAAAGLVIPRTDLLGWVLEALTQRLELLRTNEVRLLADYRAACATLGAAVRVSMPDGSVLEGEGAQIDEDGRLVVATADGPVAVSAGDVVHASLTG